MKDSLRDKFTRGAPLTFWLVVVAYILYKIRLVLEIVAIAALLAFVLQTSLRWLQKIVKIRWLAVLMLVGLLVGFGTFIGLVLLPNFITETWILLVQLPNYLNSLRNFVASIHNQWSFLPDFSLALDQLRSYIGRLLTSFPMFISSTY